MIIHERCNNSNNLISNRIDKLFGIKFFSILEKGNYITHPYKLSLKGPSHFLSLQNKSPIELHKQAAKKVEDKKDKTPFSHATHESVKHWGAMQPRRESIYEEVWTRRRTTN